MVFIYVPHRRDAIEPTAEEAALVARLRAKGLTGEDLVMALAGAGVEPERARLLVGSSGTPAAAARLAMAVLGVGLVIGIGLVKGPLRDWLRSTSPGSEWAVELLLPIGLLGFVLWKVAARRRAAADAPEGATRADQIDNRPIG